LADIDPRVKSAVALAPGTDWFNWWSLQSSAERATAPLLVVTGEHDFVTPTDMKLLDSKPKDGASRLLVEITGGNHFDFGRLMLPFFWWSDRDAARTTSARYFTAWFEKHLAGKDDHEGWTDGRTAAKDVNEGRLSRSASKLSEEEGIPLDLAKNKAVGGSEPVAVVAARAAVERTARTPGVIGALAVERGGEDRAEER
ncbi:MAG TPA: hypothetical protein VFF73_09660, partial [Planctomycetota bacterium]|nr:hypothetical protein [Planctomycetota bacterium]